MNREQQGIILMVLGALVGKVALSDLHLRYVRPGMQPLLVISAALLVLAAMRCLFSGVDWGEGRTQRIFTKPKAPKEPEPEPEHEHEHEHPAPRSTWLLALPIVVLLMTSPAALGSFAANRLDTQVAAPESPFTPLPPAVDGAVNLKLLDFYKRAYFAPEGVKDRRVRVRGFVTSSRDGWSVTVLIVGCCAADARPVKVRVEGAPAPPRNTWVAVEGVYAGREDELITMTATDVQPIPRPERPYDYS